MIPDQYKHETDYRNIPREYLDTNIPQGRGMIKWAPFAVMPEQYERIN
ncbi:YolD-like family protein, partial [Staphylococcus hominis]|nr:YolD-like family protein [Staphylococcus hominis]